MFSVRGKRKRRSDSLNLYPSSCRTRGRPMKHRNELSVSKDIVDVELHKLLPEVIGSALPNKPRLSQLEQLPNEIIQQIFFQCFEINLPRASGHLGRALSTESTYRALILFAYFDDDGQHPVDTRLFLPAMYNPLVIEEKVRLQKSILGCQWCTLARIRACLPTLSRLAMIQAWHAEFEWEQSLVSESDLGPQAEMTLVVSKIIRDRASIPDLHDTDELDKHYFAQADLRQSQGNTGTTGDEVVKYGTYLPRIITWDSTLGSQITNDARHIYKTATCRASTLAARVLPNWLVRGSPWTQGKVELLQLLRQGFHFIRQEYILEISADAIFDGMASAIKENHTEALITLLELHSTTFRSKLFDNRITWSAPSHHPLPINLFHLATRAGNESSKIMWLLIRGGLDSISNDDVVLTSWALQGQANGDEIADWLLHHMTGTENYGLDREAYLFVEGRLSLRASENEFPPAASRFAQELGYLEGGEGFVPTSMAGTPCG